MSQINRYVGAENHLIRTSDIIRQVVKENFAAQRVGKPLLLQSINKVTLAEQIQTGNATRNTLIYLILLAIGAAVAIRFFLIYNQQRNSNEKIRFFINTAHDIRTPLTLIKAPLEELYERESLSESGRSNVSTALRNVNNLLHLNTNLINLEKADSYLNELYISEYELNSYLEEMIDSFKAYAEMRHLNLEYDKNFSFLNIWLDKDKMDAILKNIISHTLKSTVEGGTIHIVSTEQNETWSIEIKNTNECIPSPKKRSLFNSLFLNTNLTNIQATNNSIGLLLVWKLTHLHKGKIKFNRIDKKDICIKATFPIGGKSYQKAKKSLPEKIGNITYSNSGVPQILPPQKTDIPQDQEEAVSERQYRLLIVEGNEELRNYLHVTLAELYNIETCSNEKEALELVQKETPDLVLSDVISPEMRGEELCRTLKTNIETSHIPIILMTTFNNERNIIEGLNSGADEYIVKPFNIGILKATIANILANRALLRHKYANLELNDNQYGTDCINCSTDIDWNFIATVKKSVEENMDNSSFNIDVLCTLLNMSRTSFYNKIKVLTDQAPADYVRVIRLKHAAQLLEERRYSITEVAERTGFSDAKYFREVFKKHFKTSPSQYAKRKK